MRSRLRRGRNADAIVINSSSDTSEASEDSSPESDPDSPSKNGGWASVNDMSEKQTMKLKSGSFGMFNHPTLMPKTPPHASGSAKKRKRLREYSAYQETPWLGRKNGQKTRVSEVIQLDSEVEDDSLFIPDHTAESQPLVIVDDEESETEQSIYSAMPHERALQAKEYLATLNLVETADKRLRNAEEELIEVTLEHKSLQWNLATLDAAAENDISDILKQRDEAVRLANQHAEDKVGRIREGLPARKENFEEMLRDVAGRTEGVEKRVAEVKSESERLKGKKEELQRQGGFELCSDVRDVQARQGGPSRS